MAETLKLEAEAGDYVSSAALLENVAQIGGPEEMQKIVAAGPWGALTVAVVAVLGLLAIWLAFFMLVFLPRGPIG